MYLMFCYFSLYDHVELSNAASAKAWIFTSGFCLNIMCFRLYEVFFYFVVYVCYGVVVLSFKDGELR